MAADRDATIDAVEQLLREGRHDAARRELSRLVGRGRDARDAVVDLAERAADFSAPAAVVCIETVADAWATEGDFATAAAVLQEFSLSVPGQIPVLLRLVEICVEGALDTARTEAQAQLIDAYLNAGRGEEARVVAEDLAAFQPEDPAHQERLRRAVMMANTPRPAEPTAEIDLTNLLGDLDDDAELLTPSAPGDDVDPIELGRTYLEMGMPDEAITQLEIAAHATATCFDASVALAGIYRERGDFARAIEWYERAAGSNAPGIDAGRGLLYDLGDLLEMSGESARALAIFMELHAADADYRDVAARVLRLAKSDQGG